MKFIITENMLETVATKWLDKNFSPDQLEIVKLPLFPNLILYAKNGNVIMKINIKYKEIYFDYELVWSFFENMFDMGYEEIVPILNNWVKNNFDLEEYEHSQYTQLDKFTSLLKDR